ncbi:MAG TPA: ATP-dependent helicase [Pyrinomonadaceae bacterium]|jgi:DNA helicase-2/ATP-dependent DNA helicase PcrA
MTSSITIKDLWGDVDFNPNDRQREAILHSEGPLFLTAGPGSGKTRVLLWRTVNLIVFEGVKPEEIFLSTFTEKAAFQLREGLRALLGLVTNYTNTPYDLSKMYVGTVHSLCQRLIADRRFSPDRRRSATPVLLDELSQYFHLYHPRSFQSLIEAAEITDIQTINLFFRDTYQGKGSASRHKAVTHCIELFNRISEECLDCETAAGQTQDEMLRRLLKMYQAYRTTLAPAGSTTEQVDFSLLQQKAYDALSQSPEAERVFKHVIIDEYQDTNTIQEKLFFKLAKGHQNICVVGDDDQALYRFRGATVENFVQFPQRVQKHWEREPKKIPLSINYRSRKLIVNFYTEFIDQCDWCTEDGSGHYRIVDKNITAHSTDNLPAVVASSNTNSSDACSEVAQLVRTLIDTGKVQDPNQIAFLFPSVKNNKQVERMKTALENKGLRVYAPRAGRFLEVEEAIAFFGVLLAVFGKPVKGDFSSRGYDEFFDWMDECLDAAKEIMKRDEQLTRYIDERREEITHVMSDYAALMETVARENWDIEAPYEIDQMKRKLAGTQGLSQAAKKNLTSFYFEKAIKRRAERGNPFPLRYVVGAVTSLDWSVLDLFYRICGFDHFKAWFDLAESGTDEGHVANLGLITQYLARFMEEYSPIINGNFLSDDKFKRSLFLSYLYALFRLGESEHEDADDPFPKGRVPFLTIHQSKGLEFPIVVLGSVMKRDRGPQFVEELIRPFLDRDGEPLARISEFDIMRMFYVALSRAQNLLVIANPRGQGLSTYKHFKSMLNNNFPRIPQLDIATVPVAKPEDDDAPRNYSYTSDYLLFQKCPRQYMIFRKFGFIPSRSQTQFFGSLVHQTIEDLHHLLIGQREKQRQVANDQ